MNNYITPHLPHTLKYLCVKYEKVKKNSIHININCVHLTVDRFQCLHIFSSCICNTGVTGNFWRQKDAEWYVRNMFFKKHAEKNINKMQLH